MLKAIKRRKGEQALKKRLHSLKRQRAFCNLKGAKTVGVLYSYKNKESVSTVNALVQYLFSFKIKCKALGYYDEKALPEGYAPITDETQISNGSTLPNNLLLCNIAVNWYGRPTEPEIDVFTSQEFDMLIDLSRSDAYVFRYITALSKAKFKVGGIRYKDDPYDLVFLDPAEDDKEFIEKLMKFLNEVKIVDKNMLS